MRSLLLVLLFGGSLNLWAQNSTPSAPASSTPQTQDSDASKPASNSSAGSSSSSTRTPSLEPPRSDRINVNDVGGTDGTSSSKDTQIDLTPPADDAKTHPHSSDILMDAGSSSGNGDTSEMHVWDPHKSAKDVEVGDFYFKRKNYVAAEDRYREALYYKDNDAIATYRLAVCLEKMDRPLEARTQFENYLKILPNGPQSADAKKAIERIKSAEPKTKAAK
jgi:tetratricopeptide (TPR) repeat protein